LKAAASFTLPVGSITSPKEKQPINTGLSKWLKKQPTKTRAVKDVTVDWV
jgi:hypothetical protein